MQMVGLDKSLFVLTKDGVLWEFNTELRIWSKHAPIVHEDQILALNKKKLVESLGLSGRVVNSLKKQGVNNIEDLISLGREGLKRVSGMGEKSRFELENALGLLGINI